MKKVLSVILALCMLAMLLPAAALADGDVYESYVYVSEWGQNGEPAGFTFFETEDPPIALYVFGEGGYVLTEDLSDMVLIVNGVSVTLGESGKIGGGLLICGGGSILSNGLLIESEAPAVPAECVDPDAIFGFIAENVEGKPLLLSGEINEIFTADDVIIAAGKPLVIKSAPEGADPNGLNIEKSLTVREGASLTGEPGQILQIRREAAVTGLKLYASDGTTEFDLPLEFDETFNYDSASGKWICDHGPGGPDEPMQDNKYHVVFTDTLGTVKAGETALENDGLYDFEAETSIAFTLTPNDAAAEPFVELEVFDGSAPEDETFIPNTVYDSLLEENIPEERRYTLALTEGENGERSFTFTPASTAYFELSVFWGEKDRFDRFNCGDDEKIVEYRIIGNGDVSFGDAELGGWCCYHNDEDGFTYYKQAVKKAVTSLTVTITPHEGWKLGSLGLAGTPLDESAYAVENGVASYTWTELDKGLDVIFTGSGGPEPPAPSDEKTYRVFYTDSLGTVKADGEALESGKAYDFVFEGETGTPIAFTLTPNGEANPFVELEVFDGSAPGVEPFVPNTVYESRLKADKPEENRYKLAMTESDGVWSFTFTPTGPKYFEVRVYWSDKDRFDSFSCGEDELIVEYRVKGNGDVSFGDAELLGWCGYHNDDDGFTYYKQAVRKSVTTLEVTIAPHEGWQLYSLGLAGAQLDASAYTIAEGVASYTWTELNKGLDVVIVPNDFVGVRLEGEAWAAPWGFGTVPLYPVGTQDEPASAVVYYGNDGTEGRVLKLYKDSGVAGNKTVAHVEIDETRLSPAAATIIETNDGYFKFEFHTSYGLIPLIVTFGDGSKGYLDLYRTGLDVQHHEVGEGRIFVRHGLEGTEYGSDAERAVTASFYYATGATQPSESVMLFVTVTTADGVERREVSRLNGSFIGTEGSDKWCDDFLLWSGTEAEWAEIVSVEAEVVSSGTAAGGTVETLGGEASASSVAFEGTVSAYVSAVRVQLLDGEDVLATDGFPVVNGAFSGSFKGLALETGKTYTLRAADYDGGEWFSVEVEVPGGSTPPSPPTPPTPPSPGGGGSTAAEKFTLTFDSNGGTEIEPVEAAEGTVVDLSEYVPEKDGYEFVGWCGSPSLGDVLEEVALTQDITVYAKWRIACDHGEGCPLSAFTDLDPDAWYHEGVHFCLTRGIMNGIGGGLFDPAGTATRAQIVTMLYRLEGEPAVDGDNPFTDVPADSFYYKSTAWASAEGIVNGYGDGIFAPDDLVTREQAATILYRYAKYKGVDVDALGANTNTLSYTDVFTISDFARPAMHFCIAIHVINGYDGYLRPQDTAARAEVAAMFQRLCDAIF